MAILKNSLLSGASGKIGRFVVVNIGGLEILRSLPSKRAESSPKQLLVQERMKRVYEFLSGYESYARVFFGEKVGVRSCYNFAMTSVLKAFKLDYASHAIIPVYHEIQFSSGPLLIPVPHDVEVAVPGKLTVTWIDNSAGNLERETDQVQLLYFVEGDKKPIFLENVAQRSAASVTIEMPPDWNGKILHVWLAFRSVEQVAVSNSSYVGSINLL